MQKDPLITSLKDQTTTKLDRRILFFSEADMLSVLVMGLTHYVDSYHDLFENIVKDLSNIMGYVAKYPLKPFLVDIHKELENLDAPISFIIPGQTKIAHKIHIARCQARKTELSFAAVYATYYKEEVNSKIVFEYLNRLSQLLFLIAYKYEKD